MAILASPSFPLGFANGGSANGGRKGLKLSRGDWLAGGTGFRGGTGLLGGGTGLLGGGTGLLAGGTGAESDPSQNLAP
jgi:hypothetical protein